MREGGKAGAEALQRGESGVKEGGGIGVEQDGGVELAQRVAVLLDFLLIAVDFAQDALAAPSGAPAARASTSLSTFFLHGGDGLFVRGHGFGMRAPRLAWAMRASLRSVLMAPPSE